MKKRILIGLLSLIFVIASIPIDYLLLKDDDIYANDYLVSGGTTQMDFSVGTEMSKFSLYGEFGRYPYLMDERVYFHSLEEQKMILNDYLFTDVDVRVTIGTLSEGGKFDSGIFVLATNAGNRVSEINAYNVNVERGINSATYTVKLHQFVSGTWGGIKAEKSGILLQGQSVDLRVVVKSGVLYAFADDMNNPLFSYNVGIGSGAIGFRNYYSPNWFDNFSVSGGTIVTDTSEMISLRNQATSMINSGSLTQQSTTALTNAITKANSAVTKSEIDLAVEGLKNAIDNALVLHTYLELTQLILEAEAIDNQGYTQNSWNALQNVILVSKTISETDIEQISYWYYRLNQRIDGLVKYSVGGGN